MSGTTGPRGIIGTQRWMTRNLDVDTYRNGEPIPEVTIADGTWASLTTGAWCYYDDDPINGVIYGKLYNWYAVNDPRGLAPIGWHVPTAAEFITLAEFLGDPVGGTSVAGGPLKAIGTDYWTSPNTRATNRSGFNAFGGGTRLNTSFSNLNLNAYFWTSQQTDASNAQARQLNYNNTLFNTPAFSKGNGLSVRVLKD